MTGSRSWSTGDTVSAADFVSYISSQVLTVFATATARDAAITSPSEGMFSYTITTPEETLSYYDGSSWTATSLTADITGITTAAASGLSGGATSGTVTLTLNLAGLTAAQNFGADGAGVDVTLHSDTAGDYALWDSSEEKLILEGTNGATVLDVTDGNVVIGDGTLVVGSDGAGEDVTFHSDTAGDSFLWDSSEEKLILEGTNAATVLDVTDGNVSIGDGTLAVSGAVTVGTDGAGADVTFHSATASDNFLWDASDEKLVITGTDGQNALEVADGNVEITDTLTVTGTSALNVTGFSNSVVSEAQMKDYAETVNAIGSKSAAFNIDFEDGNVQTVTISSGTFNIGLTNSLASHSNSLTILGTNLGAGTPSFVAGAHGGGGNAVVWAGGTAPTYTASGTDVLCFTTFDGGTTFYGFAAGLDFS